MQCKTSKCNARLAVAPEACGLKDGGPRFSARVRTDAAGEFRTLTPPGRYQVTLSGADLSFVALPPESAHGTTPIFGHATGLRIASAAANDEERSRRRAIRRNIRPIVRSLFLSILLSLGTITFTTAADDLYRREVNEKNPGGKDLTMTVQEISRDARTSTVNVKFVSGGAMPSSMFIMRCLYDMARARGVAYFIKLREWEGPDKTRMFLVGFCDDRKVKTEEYFDLKAPVPKNEEHQFMAVKELDLIFKDQR
jgi:hypothetical protein